jgi:hypothetical protein
MRKGLFSLRGLIAAARHGRAFFSDDPDPLRLLSLPMHQWI